MVQGQFPVLSSKCNNCYVPKCTSTSIKPDISLDSQRKKKTYNIKNIRGDKGASEFQGWELKNAFQLKFLELGYLN